MNGGGRSPGAGGKQSFSRVLGWSGAAALAGAAGLDADGLAAVEAGTREATVDELRRLAAALGMTLDDLAG